MRGEPSAGDSILVTGAGGQIGSELVPALRKRFGDARVIATDVRDLGTRLGTPFQVLDCTDGDSVLELTRSEQVGTIYHLAALLSVTAEANPQKAYAVNMGSVVAVLEAARKCGASVFAPSSIGAFGPGTPRDETPQDSLQRPITMYGVTKVAGELLCDYYHLKFGVDSRGVRFPGLISHVAEPGGGTTDYAVDMLRAAAAGRGYTCYLEPDTQIDMMYMPDAVRAALELMAADATRLIHRNAFNVAAVRLTPARLAEEIALHVPGFIVDYEVDADRQAIADSWPRGVDDSAAREEWGWKPSFGLAAIVEDMLEQLPARGQPQLGGT
ncbi:MAG: NAD-dependent epimerase/dehydratase family protein [Gemmatimonadota bacterium]